MSIGLKGLVQSGKNLKLLGINSPLETLFLESMGFEAAYLSGAGLSLSGGFLDEGLLTRNEVARKVREIKRATNLPILVDCDTGLLSKAETKIGRVDYCEVIAKTVLAMENAGASAMQIEDQVPSKKRCGQLPGKEIVTVDEMFWKIRIASLKRKSKNFMVVARTDARAPEGLNAAIWRAERYIKAGADAIFPEALKSLEEFKIFRESLPAIPLVANLTTHGKTPETINADQLFEIGYQIVLFPVPLRILIKKYAEIAREVKHCGSMRGFVVEGDIFSRDELNKFIKTYSKVHKKSAIPKADWKISYARS